ncbi:MFS transporter [Micromonospora sonchi]|uniref:MFS transporter n=1 Tax=Micromonospora sonchi TaxID=1763543 RepID=A0A917U015_9ACTN|nr:MFS transporter [Micromonospora sonchi]GGM47336.1 MFS transporter [Micromonospora sonchi]
MTPRGAGRDRGFGWLWISLTAGSVAAQIGAFVLPTAAVLLFGASAGQVGAVNAAATAAYPALGLFAGVLADRVPRRHLMLFGEAVRAAAFAWLPVAAWLGVLDIADLIGVALVVGAAGLVFDVAAQSHLPALVASPDRLPVANGRLETSTALAALAGPAIGGVLIAWLGGDEAPGVAAALLAASVLAVLRIPHGAPRRTGERLRPAGVGAEIREGVRTLLRHPLLRPTLIAGTLRSFASAATATIALVFALRALRLDAATVGLLTTLGGAAGVLGAWFAPRLTVRYGVGRTVIACCLSGVVWALLPLALRLPAIPVYLAVALTVSAFVPVWNTAITSLRQAVTPEALLGRVHATARTFTFSAVPLGALVGGTGSEALTRALGTDLGLTVALCTGGAVALAAAAVVAASPVRTLRLMPDRPGVVVPATD